MVRESQGLDVSAVEIPAQQASESRIPAAFRQVESRPRDEAEDFLLEKTKEVLVGIAGLVPGAGNFIGILVGTLWDSAFAKPNVWDTIRDKVKAYVDEAMLQLWNNLITVNVGRCHGQAGEYMRKAIDAAGGNPEKMKSAREGYAIAEQYIAAEYSAFTADKKYDWVTLPLFVQFANLHVSLIRDMIHSADKLGFDRDAVEDAKKRLVELIGPPTSWEGNKPLGAGKYTTYVWDRYAKGAKYSSQQGLHKAFSYQRIMYPAAVEHAWLLWPLLARYDNLKTEVPRDYAVWAGPYGEGYQWTEDFRNRHFPYPIDNPDKYYNHYQETGIRYEWTGGQRNLNGLCVKLLDGGEWCGFLGRDAGEKDSTGTHDNVRRLWLMSSNREVLAFAFQIPTRTSPWFGFDVANSKTVEEEVVVPRGWILRHMDGDDKVRLSPRVAVFGFRPINKTIKAEKIKPRSGGRYRLHSLGDAGGVLDMDRYSAEDGVPAGLRAAGDNDSQGWTLVCVDDSETHWQLVNSHSGRFLTVQDGRAVQTAALPSESTHTWELSRNADDTWSLRNSGTHLTQALGAGGEDRWLIQPDISRSAPRGAGPVLFTESMIVQGTTAIRFTVRNPSDSVEYPDWRLTATLPVEAGDQVQVTADPITQLFDSADSTPDAAIASVSPGERGVRVEVTASADAPSTLKPGDQFSCVLTTNKTPAELTPADLIPADIHLNDTRLMT
jgi:hypothetical protein